MGDGQIPYIVDHEIGAIKRSFKKAYGADEELKFTYIIVSKRINTRYAPLRNIKVIRVRPNTFLGSSR